MAISAKDFVSLLQDVGFDFFTGVPDSTLSEVIATLIERRVYVPAVREDEAGGLFVRPEEGVLTSRSRAIEAVLELLTDELVVVCNGFPSREVYALRDRPENFYMIGSMGLAPAIGLGVALAQSRRRVVVLDGDGNVSMALGTLATVGALKPRNSVHIVFDNEVYVSTGNQPTPSQTVRLEQVAKAVGYRHVERV